MSVQPQAGETVSRRHQVPADPPLYHLTHGRNLESIIALDGLRSKATLDAANQAYEDVAEPAIQQRRQQVEVPCGPGGLAHDYVPFSFAPRSPMLYRVARLGRAEGG